MSRKTDLLANPRAMPTVVLLSLNGEKIPEHLAEQFQAAVESWGVTLRDLFAAAALQGLMKGWVQAASEKENDSLAAAAYSIADAMIDARAALRPD